MRPVLLRIPVMFAVLAAMALLAGGCGDKLGEGKRDEPIDPDKGRELFQTTCRVCHALSDAKAAGVFGPDLDLLQPDAQRVRDQIEEGGGGMPAQLLEGNDADLVARYVAQVAGLGGEDAGAQGGRRGATRPAPKEPADG